MTKTIFSSGPVQLAIRYEAKRLLKPLLKVIADRIPEPNRSNVHLPNSFILCDIRDEFFKHEKNEGREYIFRAIFNFTIALYDFDEYYQHRIDWVVGKLKGSEWEIHANRPRAEHWKEKIE